MSSTSTSSARSTCCRSSERRWSQAGRGGAVVCSASMAGVTGAPNMIAYSASKAAVIGMAKSAAKDLAPAGIRVNSISPAFIGPGRMWDSQVAAQAAADSPYFADRPDEVAQQMISMIPAPAVRHHRRSRQRRRLPALRPGVLSHRHQRRDRRRLVLTSPARRSGHHRWMTVAFPHAVASFEPTASSVLLWTRLGERRHLGLVGRRPRSAPRRGGRHRHGVRRTRRRLHGRRRRRRPRAGHELLVPLLDRGRALACRADPDAAGRTGRSVPHRHGVLRPLRRGAARGLPGAGRAGGRPRAAPRRLHLRGGRRARPSATRAAARRRDARRLPAAPGPGACRPRRPGPAPAPPDGGDLGRPRLLRQRVARRGQAPRSVAARPVGRSRRRRRRGPARSGCRYAAATATGRLADVAVAGHRRCRRAGPARHPPRRPRPPGRRRRAPSRSTTPTDRCSATSSARGWPNASPTATRPWSIVASGVVVNELELDWPRPLRWMGRLAPSGYAVLDGRVMHDDQWDGYPAERNWLIAPDPRAGRCRRANRAALRRRPLVVGLHRPDRPGDRPGGGGRVHDAGRVVGGDGPSPVPRAVAGARPGGQPHGPRRVVRRHQPRLRRRRDHAERRSAATGGSSTRTTTIRRPQPSWPRGSRRPQMAGRRAWRSRRHRHGRPGPARAARRAPGTPGRPHPPPSPSPGPHRREGGRRGRQRHRAAGRCARGGRPVGSPTVTPPRSQGVSRS